MHHDMNDVASLRPDLSCPRCSAALEQQGQAWRCASCRRDWPGRGGVPRLTQTPIYWGEVPQAEMRECLEIGRSDGWEIAVARVAKKHGEALGAYLTDPRRINWYYACPGSPRDVLDLGAGWGTISANLSPLVRKVVALEGVAERVDFVALRCQQDGLENVFPVEADFTAPPFPPRSFDLIVSNGVLEWVGLQNDSDDPRELQKQFLSRLLDLLVPGGWLYVGVENRLAYSNFLGAMDHSGLPFTALMPRVMADGATRLARRIGYGRDYRTQMGQSGYRTYTYTRRGFKKLMQESGFGRVVTYAALLSYNDPRYLVPVAATGANAVWGRFLDRWAQPRSLKQRVALAGARAGVHAKMARLVEAVVPAFCIFAQRPDEPT